MKRFFEKTTKLIKTTIIIIIIINEMIIVNKTLKNKNKTIYEKK